MVSGIYCFKKQTLASVMSREPVADLSSFKLLKAVWLHLPPHATDSLVMTALQFGAQATL